MGAKYISSCTGILKIATVALALLAVGLVTYGYITASIYVCGNNKAKCDRKEKYWEEECNATKTDDPETDPVPIASCSWNFYPKMLLGVTWACFILSIAGLYAHVKSAESESKWKNKDCKFHAWGGVLLTFSGVCVVVYGINAIHQYDCEHIAEKWTKFQENFLEKLDKAELLPPKAEVEKVCRNDVTSSFRPAVFIPAGVFAFVNGCVFILIAIIRYNSETSKTQISLSLPAQLTNW